MTKGKIIGEKADLSTWDFDFYDLELGAAVEKLVEDQFLKKYLERISQIVQQEIAGITLMMAIDEYKIKIDVEIPVGAEEFRHPMVQFDLEEFLLSSLVDFEPESRTSMIRQLRDIADKVEKMP